MKFKTYKNKVAAHTTPVSCLDWSSNEEVYSVSDDHQIYKWNTINQESIEVAKLPEDFIPADLHWLLGKSGGGGGKGNDTLLISSLDGRFVILSKNARVERNISAHALAITSGRWSPDGSGLLTASEDGIIKIWSRSGMLRSTVVQSDEAILCARWSPTSSAIVFCQKEFISIKPLAANSKIIKWRAHEGFVLCLSWSSTNLIASGGDDCRYKIWDSQGTNLFASSTDDSSITSVEFCVVKDLLAIGSFNTLKLCNENGWFHSSSRFHDSAFGSIYVIKWSPDGTQVACGTSSGNLIFGNLIEKQLISKNLKATTTGRKSLLLEDIVSETSDILEFSERIINFNIGYGHLIVATSNQVHIFNENYINTPIIIDGKTDVRIIQIGKKFFLIVDVSSIWVYTYTGRLHLNPRFPGSQTQYQNLTTKTISLGMNILAIRDFSDQTLIHCFDILPGATRQNEPIAINSKTSITEVGVCRAETLDEQYIVFIDVNRELYIISATKHDTEQSIHKVGTQVITTMWASESNILVGLHDSCYSIWYCPGEACIDPTLIALTTVTIDSTEFGKYVSLHSFEGEIITFIASGTYPVQVNIYAEVLHKAIVDGKWKQALKICRLAQNTVLWATLAAIATKFNQLEISEEAYCAALQIDKVYYLQHIKNHPHGNPEHLAEVSLMMGRSTEAETILLQNKKYKEAISLCIRMHNWNKALEIAEIHKIDLDFVLNERNKYLQAIGKEETDEKFLKISNENL